MSKAHDPHWRYVALRIDGPTPLSRKAVANAVLGRARKEGVPDDEAPQLTRYEWPHAVVKVHHFRLAGAREWLPRIDFAVEAGARVPVRVETLSASGTIKALTTRLGILQERGAPPPKPERRVGGKGASGPSGQRDARGPAAAPPGHRARHVGQRSSPRPPPGA